MNAKVLHPRRRHSKPAVPPRDSVSSVRPENEPGDARGELQAKLDRANAEFSQFAYSVSHDLQEPLHKIVAFGEILEKRLDGTLDDQGRDYFARMRRAAEQQRRILEDLLRLARVTIKGRPFEDVDTAAIVRAAVVDVEARRPSLLKEGRVEIGELPRLNADPVQLLLLFQILIDNAVKFHHPDGGVHVEVNGREVAGGRCEIVVKDSGIGFDEKYMDRIFKPFQRLHGAGEYDGTGIGLAIADKIAARHAGTITACSSLGNGASFTVCLPAAKKKAP